MDKFLDDFWGNQKAVLDDKTLIVGNENILSVILATNAKNYDRFIALSEFRNILKSLKLKANIFSVQTAQIGVINAILQAKISKQKLIDALILLKNEQVLSLDEFKKISDFVLALSSNELEVIKKHTNFGDFFHQKLDRLNYINDKILSLDIAENYTKRAILARQKIDHLSFNVAVTGVINAGKSTLLNALLGEKILGSSNVPETINLTMLKYDKNPFVKVNFWDKDELEVLGLKASKILAPLVSKSIKIQKNELQNYTSASSEVAKIVKSVEIYEDLELLKDGICIVDTPGIDDAVTIREELVDRFMKEADLLIHLMNVCQSTTQKDLEFIKKTLKNSHISKILIVLTHADLLASSELNEVVSYTKKSLKNELDAEIFIISAKDYFDGKDGGIKGFKAYLYETLFGKNSQKATLSTQVYLKELMLICNQCLEQIRDSILNLNGESFGLENRLNELKNSEISLLNSLENLLNTANDDFSKIDINSLNTNYKSSLKIIANQINDRVLSEIKYSKDKGQMPSKSRISFIVSSGLNDAILSLIRQSRNEILKQISLVKDNLSLKFSDINFAKNEKIFNVGEYLLNSGLRLNYDEISAKIAKNPTDTRAIIDDFLNDEKINNLVFNLASFEKNSFENELKELVLAKKTANQIEQKRLNDELKFLDKSDLEIAKQIKKLSQTKSSLEAIILELKNA